MITLKKDWTLQALMSGAANLTNPDYLTSWQDEVQRGSENGVMTGATAVDIVNAPLLAGQLRNVDSIVIYNADDAGVTVTIRVNDNSTGTAVNRILAKFTLLVGDTLFYANGAWGVADSAGALKTTGVSVGTVDINGTADGFILDADGNTTISAPTDDQIDIEIGGADDFTFTANSFDVLTGSKIDLADSAQVRFGTGDDITMAWDGTDFDVLQATVNSSIKWGIDGAGIDQVWYGDTATVDMTWDQSADSLIFKDNAKLVLGTGSDITIAWDGTDLDVLQATANSSIKWGVDGAGIDHVFYGDTASTSMTWDQSADTLIFTGAARILWTGTTGQPEMHLTDNLADALSIEISGSTDLMVFTTTDNAESVAIHGLRTKGTTAVAISGATALTLADSGGIFTVAQSSTYDIDLPSPTSGPGCTYFFSLTAPGAFAPTITVLGGAATFVGSIITEGQIVVATGSTLTFASGVAVLGDSVEIRSIATNLYHVRAVSSILNGITIA